MGEIARQSDPDPVHLVSRPGANYNTNGDDNHRTNGIKNIIMVVIIAMITTTAIQSKVQY